MAKRTTKGRRSRRVPISDELHQVLLKLRQVRESGRVFRAAKGGQLHERNVLQQFIGDVIVPLAGDSADDADDEIGFKDGRLHSFRHFFCSKCANSGIPEQVLKKWLGHQSSIMIARYYHLSDDEGQRQVAKLGSLRPRPAE